MFTNCRILYTIQIVLLLNTFNISRTKGTNENSGTIPFHNTRTSLLKVTFVWFFQVLKAKESKKNGPSTAATKKEKIAGNAASATVRLN